MKFGVVLAIVFAVGIAITGTATWIVDPFYHYHSPWFTMPVVLEDAVYQTPGAASHLTYRDAIVGTSMTENYHTGWFDSELGWQTMKLSYAGARSSDLDAIFDRIFSRKTPVEHIFMDINDYQIASPSWTAYVERPQYLYDDNPLNDYLYLFNSDILAISWERVLDWTSGVRDNVDTAYTWEQDDYFGATQALNSARNTRAQLLYNEGIVTQPLDERLICCQENLDNILPWVEANPDTEFIIFFPPYSMLYWEQKVLQGDLEDMIALYRYVAERFLEYPNVSLYDFQYEPEIITNLDNYRDICHHRPEFNRYIFDCIRKGEKKLTMDNIDEVMSKMYEFARDFDYGVYWE